MLFKPIFYAQKTKVSKAHLDQMTCILHIVELGILTEIFLRDRPLQGLYALQNRMSYICAKEISRLEIRRPLFFSAF